MNGLCQQTVPSRLTQMKLFKHNLCQIDAINVRMAKLPTQIRDSVRSDWIATEEVLSSGGCIFLLRTGIHPASSAGQAFAGA
jgi:hypothetical protein